MADIINIDSLKGSLSENISRRNDTSKDLASSDAKRVSIAHGIAKIAALIPVIFALWVVWTQKAVDIWIFDREHYYVYNAIFLVFSILWAFVFPCRKRFTGPIMSFVYNLVPVELYLTLIYSQWHFAIAYIFSAIWACVTFFAWSKLDSADEKDPNYKSKHIRSMTFVWRRAVAALVSLLLIPSIGGVVLSSRQAHGAAFQEEVINPHLVACISNVNSRSELYEQAPDNLFSSLTKANMDHCNPDQKLEIFLQLAQFEFGVLGVSGANLKGVGTSSNIPDGLDAYYDPNTNMIYIRNSIISGNNRDVAIKALLTAVYNYYQLELIDAIEETIGWDSEYAQAQYLDTVRLWRENYYNRWYSAEELDEDSFWNQPFEKAALEYANSEFSKLIEYIGAD